MNRIVVAICLFGVVTTVTEAQNKTAANKSSAQKQDKGADVVFKTTKDKFSYGLGRDCGRRLKRGGVELNVDLLVKGLIDALNEAEPKLPAEEYREAMIAYQKACLENIKRAGPDNSARESAVYLAKNKTQKGVVTTKSGLQYKILKAGTGKSPKMTDTLKIRYSGTLTDGNQFASTGTRTLRVTDPNDPIVIKGWTEALQLMKVGAKWKLFVSPDLAYGEFPIYSNVGPHAVLVFEIELLEIVK